MTIWRGSTEIHEQPGSPRIIEEADGERITRMFRGPHDALRAYRPLFGAIMEDLEDDDFKVIHTELSPDGGGTNGPGTLTIDLRKPSTVVTEEIDMTILERPLEAHPFYSTLTNANWAAYHRWENEPDPALKGALYYTWTEKYQDYDVDGVAIGEPINEVHRGLLTGFQAALANKVLRGQTTYIAPAPVLRRTTTSATPATPANLGKRAPEAPFENAPEGYEWLKTSDRVVERKREGTFDRIEEWTGALIWDHDIYEEAS